MLGFSRHYFRTARCAINFPALFPLLMLTLRPFSPSLARQPNARLPLPHRPHRHRPSRFPKYELTVISSRAIVESRRELFTIWLRCNAL